MDLIGMTRDLLEIKQTYQHYLDYTQLRKDGYQQIFDEYFDLHIFEQMWGNTSGGFEGMGGSAMTTQTTYVLIPNINYDECLVFFNGRFAYKVPYSREFMEDVIGHNVAGKNSYSKYLRSEE